jgi:hypothetical protein
MVCEITLDETQAATLLQTVRKEDKAKRNVTDTGPLNLDRIVWFH